MKKALTNFLTTLTFLSRIPLKLKEISEIKITYFPLTGLIMALILIAAEFLLAPFIKIEIRALLLLMIYIYLSGALHLDGLGDFCDGFFAGRDQNKTAAIMRDSNTGIFALVSLILILLLKYLLFKELLLESNIEAVIIMAVLARNILANIIAGAEVSDSSVMAAALKKTLEIKDLIFSNLITLIIFIGYFYFLDSSFIHPLLLALFLSSGFNFYFLSWSKKKLGGISGDIYGTIIELTELLFLLSLTIF